LEPLTLRIRIRIPDPEKDDDCTIGWRLYYVQRIDVTRTVQGDTQGTDEAEE
jgi:hypothetical protein